MRPALTELRLRRAAQPLTGRWQQLPVHPRGAAKLGISFRPLQAAALGLDPDAVLQALLAYPFQQIRLGAYWNRLEPHPGDFQPGELDRQLDAAERAGKQVIVGLGAVKTFGYPEFFVPDHYLGRPLREGSLVRPDERRALLDGAIAFVHRVIERYRQRDCIIAWQVEHEAVDPLGMEHSWRLAEAFVRSEVNAVRAADPGRPVMMNGFLATSTPVALQQWWRTRDQGDSLAVAGRLADIVGVDFYPRHALVSARPAEPVPGRQPDAVAAAAAGPAAGRRCRGWPAADDRRRTGRALGSRHHPAQPGRPGHVQLPARGSDQELQPVHALG